MDEKILKKLENYSVLYAEDDAGVRKNVFELLSLLFKEVYLACDGQEAYELFLTNKPDLIITDIKMPLIDGLSLIDTVRKENKKIPLFRVILLKDFFISQLDYIFFIYGLAFIILFAV